MSFLQPWGLALAALAAVPILLHLMRRQVVQRVAFPALRYLRSAEQRTARSLRLRDLLLLATRVALVLLLAVAAARPLAGRGGAADHAPTDAVLLIDNTASMGRVVEGRTLLDLQLDAARDALAHASPADRFWVFPAASPPLAAGVDAAAARAALDSVPATEAGADLVARIEQATAAVPFEEGRVREVQLYTDRQASGLRGGPVDLSAWGRIAVSAPHADTRPNGFVARLELEPDGPVVPGDPPAVAVAVAADGPPGTSTDTVDVRVLVDGQAVAMARAAPGSEVLVPLPDLAPGPHAVRVELPPSGLRADDVRRLGVVASEPPAVRLAGRGDGFLAAALGTLLADGRVRETGEDGVTVVEGAAAPVPSGEGAVLLIPPVELTRLPAFQQRLDALGIPWRLEGRAATGDLRLAGGGDVPGLGETRVTVAHGLRRLAAPATADDSVLLRTSDGAPWLVRGRAGGRIYLLLASPLAPEATDLPVTAAMVPFAERLLLHWSRPSAAPTRAVEAGATITLPPRLEGLRSPEGNAVPAEGGAPWTPWRAGTWTFVLPGEAGPVERHVGVNVPVVESELRAAGDEEIRSAFANGDVELAGSPAAWTDVVFGARRGADATPWIVTGLAALVLLELLLAAPGRRRTARPEAA